MVLGEYRYYDYYLKQQEGIRVTLFLRISSVDEGNVFQLMEMKFFQAVNSQVTLSFTEAFHSVTTGTIHSF